MDDISIVKISEQERENAWEQLKNDAGARNLLLMVFLRDFTDTSKLIIEETDRCEVDMIRGEGRLLLRYIEKLGG